MRRYLAAASMAAALIGGSAVATGAQANPNLVGDPNLQPAALGVYLYGGHNYCWAPGGWHGPGWYWCGYEMRRGFGWGGGPGWRGWVGTGAGWQGGRWRGAGWNGGRVYARPVYGRPAYGRGYGYGHGPVRRYPGRVGVNVNVRVANVGVHGGGFHSGHAGGGHPGGGDHHHH